MRKIFLSILVSFLFFLQPMTLMATTLTTPAITTHNLNVREGAGTNYKIQNTLPAQTIIQILYCSNTWCMIQNGKDNGWVSKAFVAFSLEDKSTNKQSIDIPRSENIPKTEFGNYWQDNWYWNKKD